MTLISAQNSGDSAKGAEYRRLRRRLRPLGANNSTKMLAIFGLSARDDPHEEL